MIEGFLEKKGNNLLFLNWKKRWFRLQNNILCYYKEKPLNENIKPLGEIFLEKIYSIHPSNEEAGYFQVIKYIFYFFINLKR